MLRALRRCLLLLGMNAALVGFQIRDDLITGVIEVAVHGYLGCPTAHAASAKGTGENFFQTSHWTFVQDNIL